MEEENSRPTDIFLWANQTDSVKNELDVELYLFNKHFTPYSVRLSDELYSRIKPFFLLNYLGQVNLGAGTGMSVRQYELSEPEDGVLLWTSLDKVEKAKTLIELIEHNQSEIEEFSEENHEFKTIKGIVARFILKDHPEQTFYTVKSLQASSALKNDIAWELNNNQFEPFSAQVGFKIPIDNQVLITKKDIFIFNSKKFEKLFNYSFKEQALTNTKANEIKSHYRLSLPDGIDLQKMLLARKRSVAKLQKMEIGEVTQEQAIDLADNLGIDLMTDDSGAIIIMDGNDLDKFVNLIDEDYFVTEVTGRKYEIKNKKLVNEKSDDQSSKLE